MEIDVNELKKGDFFLYKDKGNNIYGIFEYYLKISGPEPSPMITARYYCMKEEKDMEITYCGSNFPSTFELLGKAIK